MTQAQAAWTYLTALFLIAAVGLTIFGTGDGAVGAAVLCYSIAVLGWLSLMAMLLTDRSTPKE